ncbi:hypothetical protein [Thiocapsa marina]|uniref:Uncharacterized protein n=1 Tax=Thiocapsa marina 5811 TaxID=768671 RepID=F9UF55_9GAMM|nr:hypothetical protein [Thiocapsa marina]EGV17092.1 hypothetical protein ThimaDRAFT_3558 [Thiocapsa marina 5811]
MKRQLLICLAASSLCGLSTSSSAAGFATWNANSGGFSYSIVNLSGTTCYLTAYGATPNPDAPSESPAYSTGWNGASSEDNSYGFFNNGFSDKTSAYGSVVFYGSDSPMQKIYQVTGNADDPTSWTAKSPMNYPYSPEPLAIGQSLSVFEPTIQMGSQPNPAAAGDSWSICCGEFAACSGPNPHNTIVMANLASAGDSLGSGLLYDADDYFVSNALINPPAPGSCDPADTEGNACGMGFVSSEEKVFNLNQNSAEGNYQATGGLWWGVENPNTQASLSLVPAMFPVNLAAYTQAQEENNNGNTQYQSFIYGGHLTFAIGDPFVISSFAAKTLWYLATTATFSLNDNTFSEAGIGINQFSEAVNGGLFPPTSYAAAFTNGLMTSTAQAGYAVNQAIEAASQANEHESFWGKVFSALFNVTMTAIDIGTTVATGGASEAAQVGIQTAVTTATGGLQQPVDNAITNAFTSNTTPGQPTTQNAPLAYNSTFASSNLLGLMLADFYVQYQVNAFAGTTASNPYPLWSNAAMYTARPNAAGSCNTLSVSYNLFAQNVECWDATSETYVEQPTTATYTNVCGNVSNGSCGSVTDSQLNIWDAVMTGSTVGADANGMLQIQNPSTWSFQPPTLISDSSVFSITTNFNLNTGTLTLAEWISASPVPTTQPTILPWTGPFYFPQCSERPTYTPIVSYDPTTGILSTTDWVAGCAENPEVQTGTASASLNMASCAKGSAVQFTGYGMESGPPPVGPYTVSLDCVDPNPTVSTEVVLNYNQCVSDQNATGGVVAMNMGVEPALACVCMPSYLISGSTTEGLVTGYYSTGNKTEGSACFSTSASANGAIAAMMAGD